MSTRPSKWQQFDAKMHFSEDKALARKMDAFGDLAYTYLDKNYSQIVAEPRLVWPIMVEAIYQSGTYSKDEINSALADLRHLHSAR